MLVWTQELFLLSLQLFSLILSLNCFLKLRTLNIYLYFHSFLLIH